MQMLIIIIIIFLVHKKSKMFKMMFDKTDSHSLKEVVMNSIWNNNFFFEKTNNYNQDERVRFLFSNGDFFVDVEKVILKKDKHTSM